MFVLYEVRVQATVFGVSYGSSSTWVIIARADQCLVNNASMVLGLSSCVAYEHAPQFVLR
jgi:hypothetical protein